jgi:hypothetical protein
LPWAFPPKPYTKSTHKEEREREREREREMETTEAIIASQQKEAWERLFKSDGR